MALTEAPPKYSSDGDEHESGPGHGFSPRPPATQNNIGAIARVENNSDGIRRQAFVVTSQQDPSLRRLLRGRALTNADLSRPNEKKGARTLHEVVYPKGYRDVYVYKSIKDQCSRTHLPQYHVELWKPEGEICELIVILRNTMYGSMRAEVETGAESVTVAGWDATRVRSIVEKKVIADLDELQNGEYLFKQYQRGWGGNDKVTRTVRYLESSEGFRRTNLLMRQAWQYAGYVGRVEDDKVWNKRWQSKVNNGQTRLATLMSAIRAYWPV